jgi:2-hydroxychromene-2-carboxylate isomerase
MAERNETSVEFFFDCSCLWAYLAAGHLQKYPATAGSNVKWRPVVAAEVFRHVNPAGRWPLPEIKQAYYRRDVSLWADFLDLPLLDDPPEPADSTSCMLACVAAGRWGQLERFARGAMSAAFALDRDLGDRAVIAEVWQQAGLSAQLLDECLAWPDVAAELQSNALDLMARGGFGVPTFFVGDAIYFGNDAVPLVERAVSDILSLGKAGVW